MQVLILERGDRRESEAAGILMAARARWAGPSLPTADTSVLEVDLKGRPLRSFIAVDQDQVTGVATVSARGEISDLAVRPETDPAASLSIVSELLGAAESWARTQGATEISFFRAPERRPSDETLADLGYREVSAPSATLKIVDFGALLTSIAEKRSIPARPEGSFVFEITVSDRPEQTPDRRIVIGTGGREVRVTSGRGRALAYPDARVTISSRAFTEFLFALRDPLDLQNTATVEPAEAFPEVLRVLTGLRVQTPWFTPLGDRR